MTEIKSLTNFIDIINKNHLDKFVYRGLTNSVYELVPSVARYPHLYENDKEFDWEKFYSKLLLTFKNQYELYSDKTPDNDEDYKIVGQHHGLITNLMDWTENPLVALYFSVANVKHYEEPETDGVVWTLSDFESYSGETTPHPKKAIVYYPKHLSKRIAAQKGVFTIHQFPKGNNKFIPLECNFGESTLKKYIIPHKVKKMIRIQLNNIGINDHTLFPDLDGLCKQLVWKFTNTNYIQKLEAELFVNKNVFFEHKVELGNNKSK